MIPALDDVENLFYKIKNKNKNVLQIIWPYSKSYQFYAVVGSTDKDPCSIDKLSNLAESRRYLRNALPPYKPIAIAIYSFPLLQRKLA